MQVQELTSEFHLKIKKDFKQAQRTWQVILILILFKRNVKFHLFLEKGLQLHSEIHVKKWVDYSTKYGLGYLLSDGSTGVYFNDSTKIILDKGGETF